MKGSPTVHLVYTTYCYDNAQVSGGIVDIVLLLFVFHFIIIVRRVPIPVPVPVTSNTLRCSDDLT